MFTSNGDNHDMFTSNDDDDDMFRIIQVDCLTKHLQWDASSSTPSHTICHHFEVKVFTKQYSLEDLAIFHTYMQKAGDSWDISPQIFFGFSAKF